jgi:hypothetical protein
MVKCLTPEEAREAILAVMPCFEQEFAHFAPVDSQYLSEKWSGLMEHAGALAFGLEIGGQWRGFLLGSVLPDLISGKLQGLEFMWLVEKEYRGPNSLQLLAVFEDECRKRGAEWIVVGYSELAAPAKRKARYAKLGFSPHCGTWFRRL